MTYISDIKTIPNAHSECPYIKVDFQNILAEGPEKPHLWELFCQAPNHLTSLRQPACLPGQLTRADPGLSFRGHTDGQS